MNMKRLLSVLIFFLLTISFASASFGDYYFFHSPVFLSGQILAVSYSVYSDAVPGWYKAGTILIDLGTGQQLPFSPKYGQVYKSKDPSLFFVVNNKSIMLLTINESPRIKLVYSLDLGTDLEIFEFESGTDDTISFSIGNYGCRREIVYDYIQNLTLEENESEITGKRGRGQLAQLQKNKAYELIRDETYSFYIKNDTIIRHSLADGTEEEIIPRLVFGGDTALPGYGSELNDIFSNNQTEGFSFRELQEHVKSYLDEGKMPPDMSIPVPDTAGTMLVIRFQSLWQDSLVLSAADQGEEIVLPGIMISSP